LKEFFAPIEFPDGHLMRFFATRIGTKEEEEVVTAARRGVRTTLPPAFSIIII